MKFIHIADVHLGASPDSGKAYSEHRPKELWETFRKTIEICEKERMDFLFIAGDLFHRQPLRKDLKEVDFLFSTLSHTKVVLIAGNHDYMKKDCFYRNFPWSENVYPLFGQNMEYVEFDEFNLAVYGFSYYAKEIKEERYSVKAPGYQETEILLAHGGDEKHIPIRKEVLERSGFDYIALGHIHKPQILLENKAAYPGALEPIDKNDVGEHGYIRGEITRTGVKIEFVPFASRQYIHLKISVDERMTNGSLKEFVKREIEKQGIHNIFKIILVGERDVDIQFETEGLDVYNNILEVIDETFPAFDYEKLYYENKENLIGYFIESIGKCEKDSVEFLALQEGIRALLD